MNHQNEPTQVGHSMDDMLSKLQTTASSRLNPVQVDWQPPLDLYHPSLAAASAAAKAMLEGVHRSLTLEPMNGRWLTLTGKSGSGKTSLANYLFDRIKVLSPYNGPRTFGGGRYAGEPPRRPRCVWIKETTFAERMREGREYDLPEYLAEDWVVMVDDIGMTRDKTDFIADALARLCSARLGKWTIFTTNLSLPEVAQRIDARVASRLVRDDNVVCTIACEDFALHQARNRNKPPAPAA